MFNMLLNVIMDTTSGDQIPDGIAKSIEFQMPSFLLGILTGLGIAFVLWLLKLLIKMMINDIKEKKKKE